MLLDDDDDDDDDDNVLLLIVFVADFVVEKPAADGVVVNPSTLQDAARIRAKEK